MEAENQKIFKNFLNAYWLRAETALWRSIDCIVMKDFEFKSPSMDLGGGDGVFSFLRADGEFDIDFDVFQNVSNLDKYQQKADIYDFYDKKTFCTNITKKPNYKIDINFDHKENLLKKSENLDFYIKTMCGNANEKLPFEDNSFNSIFSNIVYWLDNPQDVLKELNRIIKKDGKIALMLPNPTYYEFSFYHQLYKKTDNKDWKWLEKIDRGRSTDTVKHAYTHEQWSQMFSNADLEIIEHKQHLSKTIMQIWDIGLRPLFPVLHKMTSSLEKENRIEIKKEWVDTFIDILGPICSDKNINQDIEPAFHFYVLKKSK